ncbi:hypothetical protein [Prosthecobacter debontii]|nr:hypothetical protein [Prosthecobacter debontii]
MHLFCFWQRLLGLCALLCVSATAQVTTRGDAVGKLLNDWYQAGTAAGLTAITYENRDGQHSPLEPGRYPQLQIFKPDSKSGPAMGPAVALRTSPTVGNCSMSAPADKGGSLPRMYQIDPQGQRFLMMQYLACNLMIYPEHQDYDPGGNGVGGYGDLYPTNNACTLISQGSSGSDQPFLNSVLTTIAAFPPATQQLLIEKRLLMPTVQAIFRQSNKRVQKEEDYFTGIAHPVVFDAADLDEEKMMRMAHDMRPPQIPPLPQIEVIEETEMQNGRDYFEAEKAHPWKLADTPVSIARIMRGNTSEHVMKISTKKSADLMGRPVQLRWQLLQGDPRLIRLENSAQGAITELHVRWQPPIKTLKGLRSHRVDIGVFATNGLTVSAPAILSFYMLPNEMHFYDEKGHSSEICYQVHNPDLGLPNDPRDLRWLKAMLAASLAGDGLRSRLMEKLLTEPERQSLQKIWIPLNQRWQSIQKLESDETRKDSAPILKNSLQDDLAKTLNEKLEGDRGLTVRTAIERSLEAIAGFTDLYLTFQKELVPLAAQSPKTSATGDIQREIKRLQDLNVLMVEANGHVTTSAPPDRISLADRYYISGLNLTVMSQALFPEVLERSTAPAWVDPRLTTPKPWRDIRRYDEAGKLMGWIRYQAGRTTWFNPEGQLLPEGPDHPEKTKTVIYQKTAEGLLEWLPQ